MIGSAVQDIAIHLHYFLKRLRESYFSITAKWSGTTLGNMTSAPLKVDEPGHTQNPGVSAVSAASVERGAEAGTRDSY